MHAGVHWHPPGYILNPSFIPGSVWGSFWGSFWGHLEVILGCILGIFLGVVVILLVIHSGGHSRLTRGGIILEIILEIIQGLFW